MAVFIEMIGTDFTGLRGAWLQLGEKFLEKCLKDVRGFKVSEVAGFFYGVELDARDLLCEGFGFLEWNEGVFLSSNHHFRALD